MLYLTFTTIASVDLAHYRVSHAKDWVSVVCGTIIISILVPSVGNCFRQTSADCIALPSDVSNDECLLGDAAPKARNGGNYS